MTGPTELRVAAAQFATTTDVEENLATCLAMIDAAAARGAQLIVLPEFCNHLSVYDSAEHCREVAVDLDGPFVTACAGRARRHGAHVVLTVTLRRPAGTTVTNLLLDPGGQVAAQADKQTLMGNERAHLTAGAHVAPVVGTPFGPVGMYSCMDGVTCEVPRALALGGARLLTNSLNSFARDEASLHVPVRAVENQVFVVAANKVGTLVPADRIEALGAALGVPPEALHGAGESQIVAPDGSVLVKAPAVGEHVVSAVIDLTDVDRLRAARPGPRRRPALYAPLAGPRTADPPAGSAETLLVAAATGPDGAARALRERHPNGQGRPGDDDTATPTGGAAPAVGRGNAVRELQEHHPNERPGGPDTATPTGGAAPREPQEPVRLSLLVLPELTEPPAVLPPGMTVVFSRREGHRHVGVVADASGILLEQPQLHDTPRLPWARGSGTELRTVDLPWGRLAVIIGDDIRLPEVARLAAVQGVNVLATCHRPEAPADVDPMLLERAAENRLCIVAASPGGPIAGCVLIDPPADSLWSPDRSQPFDGTINRPTPRRIEPGAEYVIGTIHPHRAARREVSRLTDLVAGRSRAAAARLAES